MRARTAALAAVTALAGLAACGGDDERAASRPACAAIARVAAATLVARQADWRDPGDLRAKMTALERSIGALAKVAPDGIADDAEVRAADYRAHHKKVTALGYRVTNLSRKQLIDLSSGRVLGSEPDDDGMTLVDYAEERCGLAGGYAVSDEEAMFFCLHYQRFEDKTSGAPPTAKSARGAAIRAGAFADAAAAAPAVLEAVANDTSAELARAGADGSTTGDREFASAQLAAVDAFARGVCALE